MIGTIEALDKDKATMTVTVKAKKKQNEDKDFTLPDSATATVMGADGRTKDMPIKDALKDPAMAVGDSTKVTTGADGAVTRVEVGGIYAQPHKKETLTVRRPFLEAVGRSVTVGKHGELASDAKKASRFGNTAMR